MATTTKKMDVPDTIMATSFLKRAKGVKVLTTDNTIESYPACRMRELHNLADMFDWVILPLSLVSFDSIIKAYTSESVYYAWELYQAFNRFVASSNGHMRFYIIAPLNFLDTYDLMTNYSRLDDIIENAYFPKSLKKIQDSIEVLKPMLMETGAIINGMARIIEDNRRRQKAEEDKKKDPCIFAIDAKDDICNPKAIARIGLCWGPELTDFIVSDLPRNNGAFQSVTYPWSEDMIKKITKNDLDADMKVRKKYAEMKEAYNLICNEFTVACDMYFKHSLARVLKKEKILDAFEVFKQEFNISSYISKDLKTAEECMQEYFSYDGYGRCPGIEKMGAFGHLCRHKFGCCKEDNPDCLSKKHAAEVVLERISRFYFDVAKYDWIEQFHQLYEEQRYMEFLDFIPLIAVMEEENKYKTKEFKDNFPKFWAFYKLVTE